MNRNYTILSVALIITTIVFIFAFSYFRENPWMFGFGDKKDAAVQYKDYDFAYINIPNVISNLQGSRKRICKISLDLEVSSKDTCCFDNKAFMQEMRDLVMSIMSDYSYESLLTHDGKQLLKTHIKFNINNKLSSDAVRDVFFSEFLIQ